MIIQGLIQIKLGKFVGVTGSAITNYEYETIHPKEHVMYKLIEALKVDANYLFQDCVKLPKEANDVTLAEYDCIKKYRELDHHGKKMVDFTLNEEWERSKADRKQESASAPQGEIHNPNIRLINYYYRLASAGTGQIVFDMPPTKRIEIPNIPEYKRVDYAIGVNGNSMEPVYHDGDMLLVEMTEEIGQGDVGIFLVDNESYVKKLGDGELISLNPEYGNIPLTENSKCMGKVINK